MSKTVEEYLHKVNMEYPTFSEVKEKVLKILDSLEDKNIQFFELNVQSTNKKSFINQKKLDMMEESSK